MVLEGEPNPEVFEIKLCGVGDESRNDPFGDKSAISVNTSLSMRGVYNRRGVVLRNGDGDKNVDGDNDADSDCDANRVGDVGIDGRGVDNSDGCRSFELVNCIWLLNWRVNVAEEVDPLLGAGGGARDREERRVDPPLFNGGGGGGRVEESVER